MRFGKKSAYLLLFLFVAPALLLTPVDAHNPKPVSSATMDFSIAELNITETGLPNGAAWGFYLTSTGSTNSESDQGFQFNSTDFRTYVELFNLPTGEYSISSDYALGTSGVVFSQSVGSYYLSGSLNVVNIHFYRVNITTSGLPGNVPLLLSLDGFRTVMPAHSFTIYMPNGSFHAYAGARDYYSRDNLNFNVSGTPVDANINFARCYNITIHFEAAGGQPLPEKAADVLGSITTFYGLETSYEGGYHNGSFTSFMVPNGTYSITVSPGSFTENIHYGSVIYALQLKLASHQKFNLNVNGSRENLTLTYSETYTPSNLQAKIYTYGVEAAIPSAILIIAGTFLFLNRKRRK